MQVYIFFILSPMFSLCLDQCPSPCPHSCLAFALPYIYAQSHPYAQSHVFVLCPARDQSPMQSPSHGLCPAAARVYSKPYVWLHGLHSRHGHKAGHQALVGMVLDMGQISNIFYFIPRATLKIRGSPKN